MTNRHFAQKVERNVTPTFAFSVEIIEANCTDANESL